MTNPTINPAATPAGAFKKAQAAPPKLHLGLIGGIGPAATLVYYQRLNDKMRQAGCKLGLTIVQADVFELIENNLADRREQQAAIYCKLIDRLKAAGADCAAITSLGGHFCFEETAQNASLPLVSAVLPLDLAFKNKGLKRVGLLGTEVVMHTKLYGQLQQTEAVAPAGDLRALGQTYQDVATSGHCSPEQRQHFFAAGQQMVDTQGAEAIILAGTDLNLAFDGYDPGYQVIDALDVHVDLLARLASGEQSLDRLALRGQK